MNDTEQPPFIIKPLSYETLPQAQALRDRVFANDIETIEKDLLLASLDPQKYKDIYQQNEITTLHYWVLQEMNTRKVIGLTGIYIETDDDTCWLGWFCIDANQRNLGLGKQLLNFSIHRATFMKKKYLHIYTKKEKKFSSAIALYEKFGFVSYTLKDSKHSKKIYFKKKL